MQAARDVTVVTMTDAVRPSDRRWTMRAHRERISYVVGNLAAAAGGPGPTGILSELPTG